MHVYAQTLRKNFFHSAVSFSRLSLLRILTPSCRMSWTFPTSDSGPGWSPGVVDNFLANLPQAFGAVRRHLLRPLCLQQPLHPLLEPCLVHCSLLHLQVSEIHLVQLSAKPAPELLHRVEIRRTSRDFPKVHFELLVDPRCCWCSQDPLVVAQDKTDAKARLAACTPEIGMLFNQNGLQRVRRHVIKTCAEMAHVSKKWFQDDVKNNIGKEKSFTKSGKSPSVIFKVVSS